MVDMLWKIWKPNQLKSGQMAAVLSWCCLVVLDCTLLHLFCSFKTLFSDFTAEINKKRLKSSSSSFLVHAAPKSWSKYTTRHFVKNHLKSGQTCLVFERWDFRSQQYHNFWNKQVCHSGHESCNLACLCFGKKCMFFKFKGSWNKKTFLFLFTKLDRYECTNYFIYYQKVKKGHTIKTWCCFYNHTNSFQW